MNVVPGAVEGGGGGGETGGGQGGASGLWGQAGGGGGTVFHIVLREKGACQHLILAVVSGLSIIF